MQNKLNAPIAADLNIDHSALDVLHYRRCKRKAYSCKKTELQTDFGKSFQGQSPGKL